MFDNEASDYLAKMSVRLLGNILQGDFCVSYGGRTRLKTFNASFIYQALHGDKGYQRASWHKFLSKWVWGTIPGMSVGAAGWVYNGSRRWPRFIGQCAVRRHSSDSLVRILRLFKGAVICKSFLVKAVERRGVWRRSLG